MKILILGHGGHGKDEVAKIISNAYSLSFSSSSQAFIEIDEAFSLLRQVTSLKSKKAIFEERRCYRELLSLAISLYNTPDKTALVKHILKTNDIYVGLRCPLEYEPSKHMFDLILWVQRPRFSLEKTMLIEYNPMEMEIVINDGSIDSLKGKVLGVVAEKLKQVK